MIVDLIEQRVVWEVLTEVLLHNTVLNEKLMVHLVVRLIDETANAEHGLIAEWKRDRGHEFLVPGRLKRLFVKLDLEVGLGSTVRSCQRTTE